MSPSAGRGDCSSVVCVYWLPHCRLEFGCLMTVTPRGLACSVERASSSGLRVRCLGAGLNELTFESLLGRMEQESSDRVRPVAERQNGFAGDGMLCSRQKQCEQWSCGEVRDTT